MAPGFLVDRGVHGLLAEEIGRSAIEPHDLRVDQLDDPDAGPLTVAWTTERLTGRDLPHPATRGDDPVLDEHGRPLEMVYGIVLRGSVDGRPDEDDLRIAREQSIASYQDFLSDEHRFSVDRSAPFALRGTFVEVPATKTRSSSDHARLPAAGPTATLPSAPARRLTPSRLVLLVVAALCLILGGILLLLSMRDPPSRPPTPRVVASTNVVGAFARAAGATNVTLVAPASVRDASHYDPRQSDLAAARNADYVVYSPADAYVARLRQAARHAVFIAVTPQHSAATIRDQVTKLARAMSTTPAATKWLASFDRTYRRLSKQLRAIPGMRRTRVVAHRNMPSWADFAGVQLVGTYGPAALTRSEITRLKRTRPDLVFDDATSRVGRVLGSTGTRVVELVTGPTAGLDLLEVFRRNTQAIETALETQ